MRLPVLHWKVSSGKRGKVSTSRLVRADKACRSYAFDYLGENEGGGFQPPFPFLKPKSLQHACFIYVNRIAAHGSRHCDMVSFMSL
jgi:hypothetical protein